jgi:YD repeat-containing protein
MLPGTTLKPAITTNTDSGTDYITSSLAVVNNPTEAIVQASDWETAVASVLGATVTVSPAGATYTLSGNPTRFKPELASQAGVTDPTEGTLSNPTTPGLDGFSGIPDQKVVAVEDGTDFDYNDAYFPVTVTQIINENCQCGGPYDQGPDANQTALSDGVDPLGSATTPSAANGAGQMSNSPTIGTALSNGQTTPLIAMTASNQGTSGSPGIIYLTSNHIDEIFTLNAMSTTQYTSTNRVSRDNGVHIYHDTSTHQFVLVDASGVSFRFNDYSSAWPTAQQGFYVGSTPPGGAGDSINSINSSGELTGIQTAMDPTGNGLSSTAYTYGSGATAGLVTSATQRTSTNGGSTSTTNRITNYTYYGAGDPNGTAGSIETLTTTDGAGNVLDTEYYRYYTSDSATGYTGGLKYQFSGNSYARLLAAGLTTSSSDAAIAPYADLFMQYDGQHRVTERIVQGEGCSSCSGGLGTYTYSYTDAPFFSNPDETGDPNRYNVWAHKLTETLPDGTVDTLYTDVQGQTIMSITNTAGQNWIDYYRYDGEGRQILHANPSAVTGFDETKADLVNYVSGNAQYLSDSAGLIDLTDYYASTTATVSTGTTLNVSTATAGGAAGYVEDTKIENGETATPILQSTTSYFGHQDSSGNVVFVDAQDSQYRNTNGTGAETTTNGYTFFSGSNQQQTMTTSLPVISSSQNGPGTADVSTMVYNPLGQTVWTKDADGFISYTAYDKATGAVVKTIQDVNTSDTSDFDASTLPTGWTTPTGGGLELITTYAVDTLGRTTEMTDPNGNVTFTVYSDAENVSTGFQGEVRTYPGWHLGTGGLYTTTGPVQVTRYNMPGSYEETLTYSYTPVSGVSVPTGTDTISSSNIQSLNRTLMNIAGQNIESDDYVSLAGVTYSASTFHLGSSGTNYNSTTYSYGDRGRQDKVVDPNGTITRTVFDGLGRDVSTWIGTSDTPTTGFWSPTNNAGANMVMVSSNIYDNGGVGDGNLTESIQYPNGTTGERGTLNYFDWRDREVASKQGAAVNSSGTPTPSAETDGVHRPITYSVLDNLGETVEQDTYDGDGVSITSTAGVPNAPSSSLLVAKTVDSFDDQSREYQTQQYRVDPTTGAVSTNALTSEMFYDHRGNTIASSDPSGTWTKSTFDGAGRDVESYITDGGVLAGATQNWANAGTVANDVVLSQTDSTFDADGNTILTADHERLPGDPQTGAGSTGALGNAAGTGGPAANIYYTAMYYDATDRETDWRKRVYAPVERAGPQ